MGCHADVKTMFEREPPKKSTFYGTSLVRAGRSMKFKTVREILTFKQILSYGTKTHKRVFLTAPCKTGAGEWIFEVRLVTVGW